MKNIIIFLGLSLFTLSTQAQVNLDAAKFQAGIKETKNEVIVDARMPWELKDGFIEGAVNYNYMEDDFMNHFKNISKNTPIYIYCASGGRSEEAANLLVKSNYKYVYNLTGGMRKWKEANLPVKKP